MSRDKKKAQPTRPARRDARAWLERIKGFLAPLTERFSRAKDAEVSLLDDPIEHIAKIKREVVSDSAEAARLKAALKAVLDQHADSRAVLPHLRVLEKALGKHGLNAFDELPPDVLKRSLSQLEAVVADWSHGPLAALRARLTQRLIQHGRTPARRRPGAAASRFDATDSFEVEESTHSTFAQAEARWQRSLTGHRL